MSYYLYIKEEAFVEFQSEYIYCYIKVHISKSILAEQFSGVGNMMT